MTVVPSNVNRGGLSWLNPEDIESIEILKYASASIYGIGASKMGAMGTSLGLLILMSITVIFGNIWGFMSGEWKGASLKSRKLMYIGMSFLLIGIAVITLSKI